MCICEYMMSKSKVWPQFMASVTLKVLLLSSIHINVLIYYWLCSFARSIIVFFRTSAIPKTLKALNSRGTLLMFEQSCIHIHPSSTVQLLYYADFCIQQRIIVGHNEQISVLWTTILITVNSQSLHRSVTCSSLPWSCGNGITRCNVIRNDQSQCFMDELFSVRCPGWGCGWV